MRVRTVPVTFAEASAFIAEWHRHHRPPAGHKFSIGAADEHNVLVGVALVGRPVARLLQDGLTLTATTDIRTRGMPSPGSTRLVRAVRQPGLPRSLIDGTD